MDSIVQFIQEYWLMILVGLIVIGIFMLFVRTIFKIILVAVFIGLVLIFGFNYNADEVIDMGKKGITMATDLFKEQIQPTLEKEVKAAKITHEKDGTYHMQTASLVITGKKGTGEAKVTFQGKTYSLSKEQTQWVEQQVK